MPKRSGDVKRDTVGDNVFDELMSEIIERNIRDLKECKARLLKSRVPEDCIVYVTRNWHDTAGRWYYKEEDAIEIIRGMKDARVIIQYGDGREGFLCVCLDGRNHRNMKKALSLAIEEDQIGWKEHASKKSKR